MKSTQLERLKATYQKSKRSSVIVFLVIRVSIVLCMIRELINGYYADALLCVLSLALISIPVILKSTLRVNLPNILEIAICLFVYSSEILGEIANFYGYIPGWDTMLHTINGFLMAAVGFGIIDLLNTHSKRLHMTPLFVALVSFCFSMTIGVGWEFIEYGVDTFFRTDMQKDRIVQSISSVSLDPEQANNAIKVDNIAYTILYDAEGKELAAIEGGYLDIGIIDTMKDLLVNLAGAAVFSVCGYLYILNRDKYKFAEKFIITMGNPPDEGMTTGDTDCHTNACHCEERAL